MELFCELAERDPGRVELFVANLVSARDVVTAARFNELMIASAHPASAMALVRVAFGGLLSEDERTWAALAVGEVGGPREARALALGLEDLGGHERRLFAACLVSIYRHLGEDAVDASLAAFPSRCRRSVLEALAGLPIGSDPTTVAAGSGRGAVVLSRVARALGDAAYFSNPSPRDRRS